MTHNTFKTLSELAELVEGQIAGDGKTGIVGITNANQPLPGHITYVTDPKLLKTLERSDLEALIVPPKFPTTSKPTLISENPKLAWGKILSLFHPPRVFKPGIAKHASIDKSAKIGKDVHIEDFVYIGKNVKIGDGTAIRAHTYIDDDAVIGKNTILHPNVTIYDHTIVGNHVILHAGCILGTDGFGYVFDGEKQFKIMQIGNVVVEDGVEIGGNVVIDRATVGSTVILTGSKIDNLVQIAHNVSFGPHSVASAFTGISGSSKVGAYVTLAGQVGIGDHCDIGNAVIIGAQAGIPTGKKVPDQSILIGSPARPAKAMKKQVAAQLRLSQTLLTIKDLKKRVEELERAKAELVNRGS